MSDHLSKTSPLDRAARVAYTPSNKDLMDELRYQSELLKEGHVTMTGLHEEASQIRVQVTQTNGRVGRLEEDTAPVVKLYKNARLIVLAGVTLAPILFKIMEVALDHIWPGK